MKENARLKKEAKEQGKQVQVKRQPAKPRDARTVNAKGNKPETIVPIAYETTI